MNLAKYSFAKHKLEKGNFGEERKTDIKKERKKEQKKDEGEDDEEEEEEKERKKERSKERKKKKKRKGSARIGLANISFYQYHTFY